ncbi:uncharacterized protein LOC135058062 [Pseudophryne corroboree]|uniref:uncharacterized protein LOC135058062 n=1 Tax=Pseudophryne corroboree TaxID=495146 RepID=UPI0030819C5E
MEWPYYDLCYSVFGNTAITNPIALSSSSSASRQMSVDEDCDETQHSLPSSQCSPSSPLLISDSSFEDSTVNDDSISATIEDVPQSQAETPQPPKTTTLRSNIYNVPQRKKKLNKTEQTVRAMKSIIVDHLREADSELNAQEDARLERFLASEKEMHQTFMRQLMTMHDRQMTFFERTFARTIGNTTQAQQQDTAYPQHPYGPYNYEPPSNPPTQIPQSSEYRVYRQLP